MQKKQVSTSHYSFNKYLHLKRWLSLWHQIDEILACEPTRVLEIGPGLGILKNILSCYKIPIHTVDIDPDLKPDIVASVLKLPFSEESYDCVCAFQMLEHLPYEQALLAFKEMARVSRKNIIVSLPDAKPLWVFSFNLPWFGHFHLETPHLFKLFPKKHIFNGQHYWEINKQGYELSKIKNDFLKYQVILTNTYRVKNHQYHRFFVFKKLYAE